MAVLEQLPGVEIHLGVNGRYLAEYSDDEYDAQGLTAVSTYVESVAGQHFQVCLSVSHPFEFSECSAIKFEISINSEIVREPIMREEEYNPKKRWTANFSGVPQPDLSTGNVILNKFTFSKVATTTKDAMLASATADAKRMGVVGEIVVRLYRGRSCIRDGKKVVHGQILSKLPEEVHEKALKGQAKSLGVFLSPGNPTVFSDKCKIDLLDGDHPIATFKFMYRSREDLKSLLVIRDPEPERTPLRPSQAPSPSTSTQIFGRYPGISVNGLDEDQKFRVQSYIDGLKVEKFPVKIEPQDLDNYTGSPKKKVKLKHDGSSQKKGRGGITKQLAVIDLTDDD